MLPKGFDIDLEQATFARQSKKKRKLFACKMSKGTLQTLITSILERPFCSFARYLFASCYIIIYICYSSDNICATAIYDNEA